MTDRTVRLRLEASTQQFNQAMQQATRQVGNFTQRNRQNLQRAGLAFTAFGVGAGMALKSVGDQAIETEATFTKLQTQIGLTADEADEMREAALGMAHTGRGVQELGEAMFFVQSAGLRGAEALETTESAAKAAAIGLGETEEIAGLTTAAMNAYGSETLNATEATDVLLGSVREGSASAEDFAGSLGQVLPIASNMGVQFDEVGAAVAAMTRTGTDAGTATIQLRQILSSLLKPTEDTASLFEELGMSAQGVRDTIREDGLWAALTELQEAVGDNEAQLGRLFPNVRALSGFLDLTGESAESTEQIFESLSDTTDLLNDGFETYSETAQAAAERSAASWENARDRFGEATIGMRSNISSLSESTATWLADLDESSQKTVVHMGTAASGVATLGGAAMLAGPRIVDTTRALGGLWRVLGRGTIIGGVVLTTFELVNAFQRGRATAEEMTAEIIAGADNAEEALDELNRTAREVLAHGTDETGGLVDELWAMDPVWSRLFRQVENAQIALGLWSDEADAAAGFAEENAEAMGAWADENDRLGLTLWGLESQLDDTETSTDEFGGAAGMAGLEASGLAEGAEEAGGALDALSGNAQAAFQALAGGFDVFDAYGERMNDLAENTDTSLSDLDDSWAEFATAQQGVLQDQREWMDNLRTLRERGFDALAEDLAARGPEQAGLVADAAEQSNAELEAGERRALEIREQNAEAALTQLQSSLGGMVELSGELTQEAAEAIAEELGVTPGDVRDILDETDAVLEGQLDALEETADRGARKTVEAMAEKLELGTGEVSRIVAQYGEEMARGINPIITSVGGREIVHLPREHPMTGAGRSRAAGGIDTAAHIADEPTVLFGEPSTGGEAFIPLSPSGPGSIERSVAIWEETGRRLGVDPQPTGGRLQSFAEGGFRSLDDVPDVPSLPFSGLIADVGEDAMQHMRDEAMAWLEDNLFTAAGADISGAGAGRGNINAELLRRFDAWSDWLQANRGFSLGITSGYRSNAQQQVLYNRYLAGLGPVAAPPGASKHNISPAEAIDHNPHSWSWAPTARQFGLHHPISSESWHVEAMARGGIRGGDGAAIPTFDNGGVLKSGGVGANLSGLDEVVLPGDMADGDVFHVPGEGHFLRLDGDWHQATGPGQLAGIEALFGDAREARPENIGPLEGSVEDLFGGPGEIERALENLRELRFEQMDLVDQIDDVQDRLGAAVPLTDEWRRLLEQRNRLEDELEQRREEADQRRFDNLRKLREMQREEAENQREWAFEQMSLNEQIADISERMRGERKWSDEWTRLFRERERLQDEVASKREREAEERLRREERIGELIVDFERDAAAAVDRRADSLAGFVDSTRRMSHDRGVFAGERIANVEDQTARLREHAEGLAELRDRGLSQEAIAHMGLRDPAALGAIRTLLHDDPEAIGRLEDAFADMFDVAAGIAEDEAADSRTRLGGEIGGLRDDVVAELEDIGASGRQIAQVVAGGEQVASGQQMQQMVDRLAKSVDLDGQQFTLEVPGLGGAFRATVRREIGAHDGELAQEFAGR